MTKIALKFTFLATLMVAATSMSLAGGSIKIGAAAPKLKVAKWLKGKEVKAFEPGRTYVVEFWATWCGPCKTSIPHLTEMAQGEFKNKVQFIGVSVWERGKGETGSAYQQKVAQFVKEWGDKMNYTVAVDGEDDFMATNWMKAAEQNGIPAAFIVHDGKIAWIGHPMSGLDKTLREILAGTYDMAAAAKAMEAQQVVEAEMNSANMKLSELMAKGEFKGAVEAYEAMIAKAGLNEKQLNASRGMFFNSVAWEALTGKNADKADKAWVLALAEKAVVLSESNPLVMDTCALANFKSGNKTRAIELQEIAVQKVKSMEGVDVQTIKEMEDRLAEFKKG